MVFIRFRLIQLIVIIVLICCAALYLAQAKWFWRIFYPWPYRAEITQAAQQLNMDPYLLAALVRVESKFNARAESAAGARGLMQVMPETAAWTAGQIGLQGFQDDQLYQPQTNLLIGSWYLTNLFEDFKGNQVAGLAAYNAGRGHVHDWLATGAWNGTMSDAGRIPYPETQLYLRAVMRDYDIYKYLYADHSP